MSDSGRAAVNQKSGDITASSAARNAMGGARPTAIQNSVNTHSAQRAGDESPEREAAGGAAIAIPPGRDPRDRVRRRAREADEHRIARRVRAMERDVEVLDAEREVDRVDVLERARQGAQVCDEKHQAGKRDEQAKSRRHEVARPHRPLGWNC